MEDEEGGEMVVEMDKVQFENRSDFGDDKVNDGRNFQGLMQHKDYMKRKTELLKEPVDPVAEAAKRKELDDAFRAKDDAALKERLEKKKLALQRELERPKGGEVDAKKAKKQKGKKKTAALSFDVEEEEGEDGV
mmetsp:Transcript_43696/g.78073  ORF Transcript_43696/g.78073 Transcript_43696/m.78073 type:complete len:134 (-) Transcript_43696:18-419(-)|eukprot:CAMPEP_0177770038 /NCGR_PEP_ID=MMETSP0491_2-20121128/10690_1 /TAXON_ID=63592 /ORGANISM="Tetraselmis chuii, Strain PLY429" /LENGTH=133 /DNA_ID=CAMNT_0019287183 /DNA_START=417 /DNA_END=818 /DNA_ORIENTATION=-